MAEKKEKKIIKVDSEAEKPAKKASTAARKKTTEDGRTIVEVTSSGSATGYRVGAIVLWVLAIVCELLGILPLVGKLNITFVPTIAWVIAMLVLDLIFVIVGSQLWKKSNKIDPASKANKLKFWLWNNLGLIVCIVAFLPFIIMILKDNKKLDKKTKTIAVIAAIVALAVGGLCSYDWNPISKEEKDAALEAVSGTVYWTPYGKVYHTDQDCQALNHSDTLNEGSVEAAIEDGRTRICSFCARKAGIDTTNLLTDGNEEEAEEE